MFLIKSYTYKYLQETNKSFASDFYTGKLI